MQDNATLRLQGELDRLGRSVRRIQKGFENDPPEIAGVRQFVALAWNQIAENLPLVRNTMNAMHGGRNDAAEED